MNGDSVLVDTNVALFLLSGNKTIRASLTGTTVYVSFITQLELLGYKGISETEKQKVQAFLNDCIVVDLIGDIKERTIELRQKYNIKLPDCIIAATALYLDLPLFTADKDFNKLKEINIILFEE